MKDFLFATRVVSRIKGGVNTRMYNVLCRTMKFSTFSIIRWLGVGKASRKLLVVLLLGFRSLLEYAKKKGADAHHTNGLTRLWTAIEGEKWLPMQVVAVAALSCFTSERMQLFVMKDDRLLRPGKLEELQRIQAECDAHIQSLNEPFYAAIARCCGFEQGGGMQLRDLVATACLTTRQYVQQHLFAQLERRPLHLLRGDLKDNVKRLAAEPEHACLKDGASYQIWRLCQRDNMSHVVVEALELARSTISTSVNTLEQAHSPQSWLMRLHKKMHITTLRERA